MQIIRSIDHIARNTNSAVTIGTFDGLHKAHQEIIKKSSLIAGQTAGRNVVVTFDPHPRMVLDGENSPRLLITTDEKIELIGKLGLSVDVLLIITFTKEFSRLSSEQFFTEVLFNKVGLNNLIIGYDHNFGKGRAGNAEFLKSMQNKFSFGLNIVDKIMINNEPVNSTHIRRLLTQGEIKRANMLLGWNYSLSGTVVEGSKRGRTIGFPTANLKTDERNKLIPKNGVYLVRVHLDEGRYDGFLNIGFRPTFGDLNEISIETHIFGFEGNIYDKRMTLEFVDYIRDEKKFESKDELIEQINKDKKICLKILNNKNI